MGENGHVGQLKTITQTFGSFGCGVVWDAGKAGAKTAFKWIFASKMSAFARGKLLRAPVASLICVARHRVARLCFDDAV